MNRAHVPWPGRSVIERLLRGCDNDGQRPFSLLRANGRRCWRTRPDGLKNVATTPTVGCFGAPIHIQSLRAVEIRW